MKTIAIILLLGAGAATAQAAPRRLTLDDAVRIALRVEPLVAEAELARKRGDLGVLRAQLDRVSVKVDASLQELVQKPNIGSSSSDVACSDSSTPLFLCGLSMPVTTGGTPTTLTFAGTTQAVPAASPWQPLGLSNLQAQLNYYLFSGFRVEANVARAHATKQAAVAQLADQRKQVALTVARAFMTVRRLSALRAVQQAALDRMADVERVTDGRVRAGVAPPIDRNRARQRLLAQKDTLADLNGQLRVARAQLGVLLGIDDDFELVGETSLPDAVPATPTDLLREALARRPDLRAARLQAEAQHQQVRMARSGFFPQLTLFALFQYGNNQFDVGTGARTVGGNAANPFDSMSGNFTAGASVTLNIFDTLNTYTATADASYQERQLREEVRRYERLIQSDVRTAHGTLLKLYERRAALTAARDVAAENLAIIAGRYKSGVALVIELLDAEIELANSELTLADVSVQLEAQWLELDAAVGAVVGIEHG